MSASARNENAAQMQSHAALFRIATTEADSTTCKRLGVRKRTVWRGVSPDLSSAHEGLRLRNMMKWMAERLVGHLV